MKSCPFAIQTFDGRQEVRLPIRGLVPALLEKGAATVLWKVRSCGDGTRKKMRETLGEVPLCSAAVLTVHDPVLLHEFERHTTRSAGEPYGAEMLANVEFDPVRLNEASTLLRVFMDYLESVIGDHEPTRWPAEEWEMLIRDCYQGFDRQRQAKGKLDAQTKAIVIISQAAEMTIGRIGKAFAGTKAAQNHVRILEQQSHRAHPGVDRDHHFRATHANPYSQTLYRGDMAIEEYDAVLRNNGGVVAIDVTCGVGLEAKLEKEVMLPRIDPSAQLAVLNVTQGARGYHGIRQEKHVLQLAGLSLFKKAGKSIFEQCGLGTGDDFWRHVRAHGW